ncbi:TadE-like protein [Novipirellula aureliae]|uniref:TadE-like protein n=1 Tax=Novipirellula aureliae TaxID=2527966 RepID=A0A5C6DZN3_9BACT|nr:TadE/TadG family type IV pilus assembly protein [Novipirellula aureliae]TWU41237.1 TadE-like protein [Novipirellula aureliae]
MNKRKPSQRSGAVMVEFAIVVPILFLFFFAAFEFCRVSMIRHTADNAVYEAARTAMIPGATATDARQAATAIMSSLGVSGVNVTVTPATIDRDTADVTVEIAVPLVGNSFVPIHYFRGDIVRELTMHREGAR